MGQFNLEEYAKEVGPLYDYKYDYVDFIPGHKDENGKKVRALVGIYCHEKDKFGREHGLFWKTPTRHKCGGQGCPKCSGRHRMNTDELIEISQLAHNSQIDNLSYEKTEFKKYGEAVIVTCHNKDENGIEHGDFPIMPIHLINGQGCPKCRYIKSSISNRRSFSEVLNESRKVHGDKYDYSLIKEYKNDRTRYPIICKEHGVFWQTFNNHIKGETGCPECGRKKTIEAHKLSDAEWKERAKKVHKNDPYDYSETVYKGSDKSVFIRCLLHGVFEQSPTNHVFGQGCPICRQSKLEKEIRDFLIDNGIEFIQQHTFDWLGRLSLDFYIPEYNVAIECQGKQHFLKESMFGGESLEVIQERDKRKKMLCDENGVKLLYYSNLKIEYPYDVFEDKYELLKEIKHNGTDN